MPGDQNPQAATRYSLRTRTPVKASAPVPPPPTSTPRRRSRPSEAAQLAKTTSKNGSITKTRNRASSVPSSKRRASTTSRRTQATRDQTPTPSTDNEETIDDDGADAAEMSSEDEEFSPEPDTPTQAHKKRAMSTTATTPRRGPGRPRKDGSAKRSRADDSSSRSAWDTRRAPANLTKHDPFKVENLAVATRIMQQIPVKGTPNDDRYELMKLSDALKMCGYELGVADVGAEHLNEVYRMLSWSVHAAGPNGPAHPPPPLSEEAKNDLIRVFASIGRRIREETKDMAGYHRRHALRKLMLAKSATFDSSVQEDSESKGNTVHRRNPLKVPGPLVDIWKVPYKKSSGNDGNDSPVSDA